MSDVKALEAELNKLRSHSKRQNHHIISQKNFIDEVVQANLALRTNVSLLSEGLKQLENEKVALQDLVARVEELERQLEEARKPATIPPAEEQDAA